MLKCEIRADNTLHIEGYVNAVERDSRPVMVPSLGRCVEQVRAGVFGAALAENPDVELLENHDHSRKLGSTSDGVLTLSEDSIGLRASADISDPDMITKARTGQLKGWSFGFVATSSEVENRANGIPRRTVTGMKLSEVSLIDGKYTPCYAGTLVEVRAVDDSAEMVEFRADEDIEIIDSSLVDEELRYNPYHDPSNGRFCSGGGSGGGGVLMVEKGQKGKGIYVFDRDIDSEYEQWKQQKSAEKSNSANANLYNRKYATPDEYKQALAEKYNGITDVNKIKSAKDVSDFINYDTQSRYYGSTGDRGNRMIQSTWKEGLYGYNTNGFGYGVEISPVKTAAFSDNGTTILEMPKGYSSFKNNTHVFDDSIAKLEKAGIRVGHWHDDTYMVTKKKGARTSKWLEGLEASRSFGPIEITPEEQRSLVDACENEAPAPDYSYYERAMKLLELRYNPYHDPSNGRFCSGGGGGGGGVLVVEKGQKGKGVYVVDVDHDDEYEQWKADKAGGGVKYLSSDNALYESPDEVLYVEREKKNGFSAGGDDVLTAKSDGNGNITLSYATPNDYYQQNSNTSYALYEIKSGITNADNIHGSREFSDKRKTSSKVKSGNEYGSTRSVGIDWSKVKSVTGQTYNVKDLIKSKGFKWDKNKKGWVK